MLPAKFISFPRPTNCSSMQLALELLKWPATTYDHVIDPSRNSNSTHSALEFVGRAHAHPTNCNSTHQGVQLILLVQQELHALVWSLANRISWPVINTAPAIRSQ